eukprot:6477042-Amphidinium_carterae.1
MIAEKSLIEAQIKEIQSKLMAEVAQHPASPASHHRRVFGRACTHARAESTDAAHSQYFELCRPAST